MYVGLDIGKGVTGWKEWSGRVWDGGVGEGVHGCGCEAAYGR